MSSTMMTLRYGLTAPLLQGDGDDWAPWHGTSRILAPCTAARATRHRRRGLSAFAPAVLANSQGRKGHLYARGMSGAPLGRQRRGFSAQSPGAAQAGSLGMCSTRITRRAHLLAWRHAGGPGSHYQRAWPANQLSTRTLAAPGNVGVYPPRVCPSYLWYGGRRQGAFVALSLRGIRASPSPFLFLVDGMSGLPHKWSMGWELRR